MTSRRNKVRAARKVREPKLVQPRLGAFEPDPGPFGVSYYMLDHEGPFPWPRDDEPMARELRWFLDTLTRTSLDEVVRITRVSGSQANKHIEVHEVSAVAQKRLDELLVEFGREDSDFPLWEFTYCLRRRDPRRIWAWVDLDRRTVYPIWWDPQHRVIGHSDQFDGVDAGGGPCPAECVHPVPAESTER